METLYNDPRDGKKCSKIAIEREWLLSDSAPLVMHNIEKINSGLFFFKKVFFLTSGKKAKKEKMPHK